MYGNRAAHSRLKLRRRRAVLGLSAPFSPLQLAPAAYWPLQEASGNAIDASGNGNTGVATASPGQTTGPGTGPLAKARGLNGSTQYFSCPSTSALNPGLGTAFSVSCWFNSSSISTYQTVFSSRDNTHGTNWQFFVQSSKLNFGIGNSGNLTYGTVLSGSTWYQATMTMTAAGAVTVYLNGASVLTGSATAWTAVAAAIGIGCDFGNAGNAAENFLDGAIAGAGVFDSVLTAAQIAALYVYK
jgi:Concanavalin A-like lectin/glucanases superfamily